MDRRAGALDEVQLGLDSYFSYLSNEWTLSLIMEMHVGAYSWSSSSTKPTDVNEFIGNKEKSYFCSDCAYFTREHYPVPSTVFDKKKSYDAFQSLYKDLICAARASGFELVQKGQVPESQLRKCKNSTGTGHPFDGWDLICG